MKFIKGYCPHCTTKVLMKSTAERLTCPHCGKEYCTEEANRLYESIIEEKQSRKEEEIRKKSILYVNSTYESNDNGTKTQVDVGNITDKLDKSYAYGAIIVIIFLFLFGLLLVCLGPNSESDLSETVNQERTIQQNGTSQTEPGTAAETEENEIEVSGTDNENAPSSSLTVTDEDGNMIAEYSPETAQNTAQNTEETSMDADELTMQSLLSNALAICRLIAFTALVFELMQYILAFKNEDPEQKARAIRIFSASFMLIFILKVIKVIAMT